jgi:hypothetical protein
MSSAPVSYRKLEPITLREHLGSPYDSNRVGVAPLLIFQLCDLCLACLRSVSCVLILDWPFVFVGKYSQQINNRENEGPIKNQDTRNRSKTS